MNSQYLLPIPIVQVPATNTDTLYHYDTQGHLIGESPVGSAQYTREYIYLGEQPVAVMK